MSKYQEISVRRLMLDENNPRFRRPMGQDEAIAEFSNSPKTKALAKHITLKGVNPLEAVAVMPIEGTRKFIVREGNRRIAALKLLHDPHLAETPAGQRYYAALAQKPDSIIPEYIHSVIFDSDAEVREWIGLKHVSDSKGISTLYWLPWEKANFDSGTGRGTKYRLAHEAVSTALELGWITEADHNKLNLSTLSRVLEDEKARSILGFQGDSSGLFTTLDQPQQAKLIQRLILDTGKKGTQNSRTLKTTKEITKYSKSISDELKLKPLTDRPPSRWGVKQTTKAEGAVNATKKSKPHPEDLERKHLVPKTFKVDIGDVRAAAIAKELRKLDLNETPNAIAVLFRIFLEFSIYHYAAANNIERKERDSLADVLRRVTEHLQAAKKIKKGELAMVNKGLNTQNNFLSISQINQYVHNPLIHPTKRELTAAWNGTDALLRALWLVNDEAGAEA